MVEVRLVPQPTNTDNEVAICFTCSKVQAACFAKLMWSHVQGGMVLGFAGGMREAILRLPGLVSIYDNIRMSGGTVAFDLRNPAPAQTPAATAAQ